MEDKKKEILLERQYRYVLDYTEIDQLVEGSKLKGSQIRGWLTSYCNQEKATRPTTFCEMEEFAGDFIDWCLEAKGDDLSSGGVTESALSEAVRAYLAFATVWKAKIKGKLLLDNKQQLSGDLFLLHKNALGTGMKTINSQLKRNPGASAEQIKAGMIAGYSETLAVAQGRKGLLTTPETEDVARLIGAYFAGDKIAIEAAQNLKALGHTPEQAAA